MTPGTTNRQQNRFADAYIEPEYESLTAIDKTELVYGGTATFWNNTIIPVQQAAVERARDSKNLESPTCWIAYVGAGGSLNKHATAANFTGVIAGMTGNNKTKPAYEWSLIFSPDIATFYGATAAPTAIEKVAVHEVAHQFFNSDTHHGGFTNLVKYYNAKDELKHGESWINTVNIMNTNAILVPMNNGNATIPLSIPGAKQGNSAGPIDRFYFTPGDILKLRKQVVSP